MICAFLLLITCPSVLIKPVCTNYQLSQTPPLHQVREVGVPLCAYVGTCLCVTAWVRAHVWMRVHVYPAVSEFYIEITLKERLCAQLWYWMPSCSGLSGCVARTSERPLAASVELNSTVAMRSPALEWWCRSNSRCLMLRVCRTVNLQLPLNEADTY